MTEKEKLEHVKHARRLFEVWIQENSEGRHLAVGAKKRELHIMDRAFAHGYIVGVFNGTKNLAN